MFKVNLFVLVWHLLLCQYSSSFVVGGERFRSLGVSSKDQCKRKLLQRFESAVPDGKINGDTQSSQGTIDDNKSNAASLLLSEAIGFNASSAASLLSEIDNMRSSQPGAVGDFLNELLASGPDASLPFWTRSRLLTRFSKRARMASLRRTLDMATPPPSIEKQEQGGDENSEEKLQRRRRALVTLLRQLSTAAAESNDDDDETKNSKTPGIVALENKARKDSKEEANLRSRLPEGLETPEYEVIDQRSTRKTSIEIRRYKPYSVCSVGMNKPRSEELKERTDAKVYMPEMSGATSFGALAGYLFGKNDQSVAMKMTTPVFTAPGEDVTEEKQMQFVLPSEFWEDDDKLSAAPKPLSGSGVSLQRMDSEERAVIMFGGYASKKEIEKRKRELLSCLSKDPAWKAKDKEILVAQYNDPFTVPWRRLNEVSVKVAKH